MIQVHVLTDFFVRNSKPLAAYKLYHVVWTGCKMGHGSDFVVEHGALVRIPDPERGDGCFKSCICSTTGSLRPCVTIPCTDEQLNCEIAGQMRGLFISNTFNELFTKFSSN